MCASVRSLRPSSSTQGASRAGSLHEKKDAAEEAGRKSAINEHSELLIHGKDGKIQERNTYKRDPYPSEG